MSQTAISPAKRKKARKDERNDAEREKCTLLLYPDVSIKLTVEAHARQLDRSELVNRLLDDALSHVVISFRGQSNGSASHTGEVSLSA